MPQKRSFGKFSAIKTVLVRLPAYRFAIIALSFWLILTLYINLTSPQTASDVTIFYLIVFATLFSTFFASFGRIMSGLLLSAFMVSCLVLQQYQLLSPFNFLLLSGFLTSIYFLTR